MTTGKKALLSGREYDKYFPAPAWRKEVVLNHLRPQSVVREMGRIVCETTYQTAAISQVLFRESRSFSRIDVLERVWTFTHNHIQYEREDEEQLREPARLWAERKGDCDCYSIFIGSILLNLNIPFVFRITKYKEDEDFGHVYIVAFDENDAPVYLDCVLPKFNAEHPYRSKKDYGLTCKGLEGLPGGVDETTEETEDEESAIKKIAKQYVTILKDKGKEAAEKAVQDAAAGNFQDISLSETLSTASKGMLGALLGTAAGVTCTAFGVPGGMCAEAGQILGNLVEPSLFKALGWSSKPPDSEEKQWADSIAAYWNQLLQYWGIAPNATRRDNVRNDFNRLFGVVDNDGRARRFGLTNGIQLYSVFKCYLETIRDNADAIRANTTDAKFKALLDSSRPDKMAAFIDPFYRQMADYDRAFQSFAFYRLFGANRDMATFDWNSQYHKPGDEISKSMIFAILDEQNPTTMHFMGQVMTLSEQYPKLKACIKLNPAGLGILAVWKVIRDSNWDWNRVDTLTKQMQANLKRQLDNPDSPLREEIAKQLASEKKDEKKAQNFTPMLVAGACIAGLLVYNKYFK